MKKVATKTTATKSPSTASFKERVSSVLWIRGIETGDSRAGSVDRGQINREGDIFNKVLPDDIINVSVSCFEKLCAVVLVTGYNFRVERN